jgi:uncharacterized protein YjiS (DUF1127 family)
MRAPAPAIDSTSACPTRQRRFVRERIANALAYAELIWAVHRERNQLRALDTRLLKDLGLTQEMVEHETSRHFLDIPESRKNNSWL